MKVLKKIVDGLILYEDLSDNLYDSRLLVGESLVFSPGSLSFVNDSVWMPFQYEQAVIEVANTYNPTTASDVGGLSFSNGIEESQFYEYYNVLEPSESYSAVRVVVSNNVLQGYGKTASGWVDRGTEVLRGVNSLRVSATGLGLYELNSLKVYKSDTVVLHSLMPGWTVQVFAANHTTQLSSQTILDDRAQLKLPEYPFTGQLRVYDDLGDAVTVYDVTGVWGGDEYAVAFNVDILDDSMTSLSLLAARNMGVMDNGLIERVFTARNLDSNPQTITLRVADYSPYFSWVTLANDAAGVPSIYSSSISVALPALGDVEFWVHISVPADSTVAFDPLNNSSKWFLEVV